MKGKNGRWRGGRTGREASDRDNEPSKGRQEKLLDGKESLLGPALFDPLGAKNVDFILGTELILDGADLTRR